MNRLLKEFAEFAQEQGYTVDTKYSGRCMYGQTCFGLVGDQSPLGIVLQFVTSELENAVYSSNDGDDELCLGENDFKEIVEFMEIMQKKMAWDNMGRQTVFYWPDIAFEVE